VDSSIHSQEDAHNFDNDSLYNGLQQEEPDDAPWDNASAYSFVSFPGSPVNTHSRSSSPFLRLDTHEGLGLSSRPSSLLQLTRETSPIDVHRLPQDAVRLPQARPQSQTRSTEATDDSCSIHGQAASKSHTNPKKRNLTPNRPISRGPNSANLNEYVIREKQRC
jgi:hypothetical protein